jgi:short-subunit dehydrogenase
MKHLLITGASGNLGSELIQHFNFNQYDKVYLVRSEEKIKLPELWSNKFEIFQGYDLSDEEAVKQIFESIIVSKEDELFVIHLVGGYTGGKFFWEFGLNDLKNMLDKNLISSFLISKYTARVVKECSGGSIVLISSKLSIAYEAKRSVYSISKSALNFLVKIVEVEGKEINLTANALLPKIILTNENKKWISETDYPKYISPQKISDQIEYIFRNYKSLNGNLLLFND